MVYRHRDRLARIRTLAAMMQRHALPPKAAEMIAEIEALAGGWSEQRRRAKRDRLAIAAAFATARALQAMANRDYEEGVRLLLESAKACAELAKVDPEHHLVKAWRNREISGPGGNSAGSNPERSCGGTGAAAPRGERTALDAYADAIGGLPLSDADKRAAISAMAQKCLEDPQGAE